MKIVIIGRGNVATNLEYAFRKKGVDCQMVSSRENLDTLPSANVYIYSVKDEALTEVAAKVTSEGYMNDTEAHEYYDRTLKESIYEELVLDKYCDTITLPKNKY